MGQPTKRTPAKKEKNRLPEKQSTSTNAFKPRNDKQREFCNLSGILYYRWLK